MDLNLKLLKKDNRTAYEIEWDALCKKEAKINLAHQDKEESKLNQLLADKVPDKLQSTLDVAFEKAFYLVFEKGTGLIEKTYDKNKIATQHKVDRYSDALYGTRRSLKKFSDKAVMGEAVNIALTGVSGIGMGIAGIGLPDIPVFTGFMLKSVYEIALRYGYSYDSEEERFYILMLIEAAASYGDRFAELNRMIDDYGETERAPENFSVSNQIGLTSRSLSKELLYMKFLQGIPVIGSVGGAYDVAYLKRISDYARIKYQKRFMKFYHAVVPVDR